MVEHAQGVDHANEMGRIAINGLKLMAYHGVLQQERRVGNIFVIDIWIDVPKSELAQKSDKLEDTINYAEVVELIKKQMHTSHALIEKAAGAIIEALKLKYGHHIRCGEIRITKLAPPISAELEGVSYTASFG